MGRSMEVVRPPALSTAPLVVPERLLMGPGPSNVPARVLAAAGLPLLGHMHPQYLKIMDEVKQWLRYAFQTENDLTLAVSGSGHAAMEAAVANIVEPGEVVLIGVNGIWGERAAEIAERHGAEVHKLVAPGGEVFSLAQIEAEVQRLKPTLLFLCHGDSSTGTLQPLDGIGRVCRQNGCLFLLDCVTTVGGVPVYLDEWQIDAAYSGSQKVLNVPPGASPLSLGPRVQAKMASRKHKVRSYYLDMALVGEYWGVGSKAAYHHTGLVTNVYALREGLAILAEEGLTKAWDRHQESAELLWQGLERLGLSLYVVEKKHRLPTVTTIRVPEGVNGAEVSAYIMGKYSMEVAGGLGPTAGKCWRVGLMGKNATPANVAFVLVALEDALRKVGFLKPQARL